MTSLAWSLATGIALMPVGAVDAASSCRSGLWSPVNRPALEILWMPMAERAPSFDVLDLQTPEAERCFT